MYRLDHWNESLRGLNNPRRRELAVSLSLFDSVRDPLPSWLCLPEFRLGNGDEWEGPFAHSFETASEQDE